MKKILFIKKAAILALTIFGGALCSPVGNNALFGNIITANAETSTANFDSKTGTLTLSGEICRDEILELKTNRDIETIICAPGAILPADCSELFCGISAKYIDVSNADASKVTNAYSMFYGCGNLHELIIDFSKATNLTNMQNMFAYCPSLISLDLSNFNTKNVTNMRGTFVSSGLKELDLSNFYTSNVTDMSFMFAYCNSLSSIDISSFDTKNVTNMSGMFRECISLNSIDVSHFNTSKVTSFEGMFKQLVFVNKLEEINISGLDTSSATDLSGMFSGCKNIKSIDVSSFNTSKVKDFSGMFESCGSLISIDVSNFDTSNATCLKRMFGECHNLESIDVSNFDISNATDLGGMFAYCGKITSFDLKNFNTQNVTNISGMFCGCTSLSSVDVSSFDTSKVTGMSAMFADCTNISSLDVSNFDTSNVTDMDRMFDGCSKLTALDLSNFNTHSVRYMNRMFRNCSSLTNLDVSNFVTTRAGYNQREILLNCPAYHIFCEGVRLTLDNGFIGISMVFVPNAEVKTVVMESPNGIKKFDISELAADENGRYTISSYVNAIQSREKVTFSFYDTKDKKINLFKNSLGTIVEKQIMNESKFNYSVNDYILEALENYTLTDKEKALIYALYNYCSAAENYFKGSSFKINGIENVNLDSVKMYAPPFDEKVQFSLVLNSATAMRFYADKVSYKGKELTIKKGKYGNYFEIENIPAQNLSKEYTVTLNGTEYRFAPLAYVYRVLNKPDSSKELTEMAKAIYVYANAVNDYIG
ncbi:BspA family leucine-rich repeat surface protein [Ruminococcus sp.]|uniref:BspA family leucine-rich repeat surface protein n=1 Tax=Ruminococcus sp. TaxID=41978 RepID=UPI0025F0B717|nr:BspA family leucine-rich repeat surface protein [Ruminococcus sp.]